MNYVEIHPEFRIVIRKQSLSERGVSIEAVEALFQRPPLDQNASLLSFGPHVGQEAALVVIAALERLGLVCVDDFFMFAADCPDWCRFGPACVGAGELVGGLNDDSSEAGLVAPAGYAPDGAGSPLHHGTVITGRAEPSREVDVGEGERAPGVVHGLDARRAERARVAR